MANMNDQTDGWEKCAGNDLSNYITQIKTDIGKSFNKELFLKKIAKVAPKPKYDFGKSKRECKMASATNPLGISSEEYGDFAIHVYRYLSYIKSIEAPAIEVLQEAGKLVNINRIKDNSKKFFALNLHISSFQDVFRYSVSIKCIWLSKSLTLALIVIISALVWLM